MKEKKFPPGHWLAVGLGIGLVAGIIADVVLALYVKLEFLWFGFGSTLGLIVGVLAGYILEHKNFHRRSELSPTEKKRHKMTIQLTLMSVAMLIIVSVFLYLKKRSTEG
jgi:membrane protein YqaA with SNARE-associated domain